jgi:putative sterol carrier protein
MMCRLKRGRYGLREGMTATTEFFEELSRRRHEPMLEKLAATVRFDLARDGRIERWLVAVDKGDIAVSRRNAKADCIVRTDGALFDGLVSGEVNAMAALLRGAIGVEGDPWVLVLFQRLFSGPAGSRDRRDSAGYARRQP